MARQACREWHRSVRAVICTLSSGFGRSAQFQYRSCDPIAQDFVRTTAKLQRPDIAKHPRKGKFLAIAIAAVNLHCVVHDFECGLAAEQLRDCSLVRAVGMTR